MSLKLVSTAIVVLLLLFFCHVTTTHASPLLTELHPAPATGQPEWIELHNPDPEPADLAGWHLWDELSTPSLMLTFTTTLTPGQTQTFDLPSAKLNNTADGVQLRAPDGQVVDAFSYTTTESQKSWLKIGADWQLGNPTPNAYQSLPTPSPSPTQIAMPNPTPSPSPLAQTPSPSPSIPPPTVAITELFPCPASNQTEYIRLTNTGSTPLDLTQLIIRDEQHNTRTATGILAPGANTEISWATAMCNNSGDTVFVLTQTEVVLALAQYNECTVGQPLQFIAGAWQTIQGENQTPQPSPSPIALPTAVPLVDNSINQPTPLTAPAIQSTRSSAHVPLPILLQTAALQEQPTATGSAHVQHHNTLEYLRQNIPRSALLSAILSSSLLLFGGTTLLNATQKNYLNYEIE